ncbi:hypothetical protein BKA59DRAFT_479150 [Fusarium tricinctum]|uniref:Transposase n=1 Tax=Fusarium tricinctum TaxID=61284 RepID=A0A8K0RQP3_9HYPO|nr:hypothetical protein BKA59DRAFT_479150 [Fusarium tricinctum]
MFLIVFPVLSMTSMTRTAGKTVAIIRIKLIWLFSTGDFPSHNPDEVAAFKSRFHKIEWRLSMLRALLGVA